MLVTILSFILILSVLVLIHELGHYLTAKKLGVKVEEFGFGFPPRVWGKKIGETIYSINWLPIGGFVKLYGEDDAGAGKVSLSDNGELDMAHGKKPSPISHTLSALERRAFYARPIWQRFTIVFAGVFMNFMLAVVLLTFLVSLQGIPTPGKSVVIAAVAPNSPAQKAGLKEGDTVVAVDNQKVTSAEQLISYTKEHLGKQVELQVISPKSSVTGSQLTTNNSSLITIHVTPRVHYPANEGAMGVAVGAPIVYQKYPWYQAPWVGIKEALSQTVMILQGLGQLVTTLVLERQVPQGLAGPVGIAQLTGQVVQIGPYAVMSLLALLSLNLAILNVLPIPALDGGRLFFIVWEAVTRRKISPTVEAYAHAVGMIFLLALIAFITFHDLLRIFSGQSLLPR